MERLFLFKHSIITKESTKDVFGRPTAPQRNKPWEDGESEREILHFVKEIKSPDEISDLIKMDIDAKYFLLRGQAIPINFEIPIFLDGRNLSNFKAEFSAEEKV